VYGHIRGKRTSERNNHLRSVSQVSHTTAAGPPSVVWVYLNELAHNDMLEFGHVLPKPGDEQSWFEDLPSDLRDHMVALDHSAGA
jgi:hypothetical protein